MLWVYFKTEKEKVERYKVYLITVRTFLLKRIPQFPKISPTIKFKGQLDLGRGLYSKRVPVDRGDSVQVDLRKLPRHEFRVVARGFTLETESPRRTRDGRGYTRESHSPSC